MSMQNTLILTGWGWKEYSVAAAAVLQALGGAADVRGVSRRVFDKFGQNLSRTADALKVARNTVRKYL